MFYFDPLYMLILVGTGLLSGITAWRVKSTFRRMSKVGIRSGKTGAEIARGILAQSGIFDVEVERVSGFLSDHYDPRNKKLRLSPDVFEGRSIAAAGVAAHEVGHALQHASNYFPLQVRSYLAPAAGFGSNIGLLILVLGLALQSTGLFMVGVIAYSVMVLFVLVTLPVEFDASKRARRLLPALGFTDGSEEAAGVSKVLSAAAMTYVASAVAAIAQLLYFLIRSGLLGGRDD